MPMPDVAFQVGEMQKIVAPGSPWRMFDPPKDAIMTQWNSDCEEDPECRSEIDVRILARVGPLALVEDTVIAERRWTAWSVLRLL